MIGNKSKETNDEYPRPTSPRSTADKFKSRSKKTKSSREFAQKRWNSRPNSVFSHSRIKISGTQKTSPDQSSRWSELQIDWLSTNPSCERDFYPLVVPTYRRFSCASHSPVIVLDTYSVIAQESMQQKEASPFESAFFLIVLIGHSLFLISTGW